MNKDEVLRLAKLARIDIQDEEAESLSHEFGAILNYFSEIKSAKIQDLDISGSDLVIKNVLREDKDPHESGIFTEKLMAEVPSKDSNFVKVKKILS